jgi:hypothetical protein
LRDRHPYAPTARSMSLCSTIGEDSLLSISRITLEQELPDTRMEIILVPIALSVPKVLRYAGSGYFADDPKFLPKEHIESRQVHYSGFRAVLCSGSRACGYRCGNAAY